MKGFAMTFAGCAICSLLVVYDTTPIVQRLGKIAVCVFGVLFLGAALLALFS